MIGWRSDRNWRDVADLHHGTPRFADSAERYEGGMLPFPSIYAMGAVIDLLLEVGLGDVESRVLGLAEKTRSMLRVLGAEVNTDNSQIVTAVLPGCNCAVVSSELKKQRILTSARRGRLRISPHLYNTEDDIELLRSALVELQAQVHRLAPLASAAS